MQNIEKKSMMIKTKAERDREMSTEKAKREREMKKETGEKKTERSNIVSDSKGLETFAWRFRSLFSFLSFQHL